MTFGEVLDNYWDWVGDHHKSGYGLLKVATHSLLEAFDLYKGVGGGYAELIDERENSTGRDTTTSMYLDIRISTLAESN